MSDLAAIRKALAATLGNMVAGGTQVNAVDRPASQISTYPTVFLGGRTGLVPSQGGGIEVSFPVIAVVGRADNPSAHDDLDRFIYGDLSIDDQLVAFMDLGLGDVNAAVVDEWEDTVLEVGGVEHLAVRFTVKVSA